MKTVIDRIILQGLYNNHSLSQTMETLAAETGISLCLYSLSLLPLLYAGNRNLTPRFDSLILQFYQSTFSMGFSFSVLHLDEGFFVRCPVSRDGNQIALLIFHTAEQSADTQTLRHAANRLTKLCSLLTVPDTSTSMNYGYEKLWLSNLILNTHRDIHALQDTKFQKQLLADYAICAFSACRREAGVLRSAEREINHFFPAALHVQKNDHILVFLYNLPKGTQAGRETLNKVMAFCSKFDLLCGISSCFSSLIEKNDYILQASDCLKLATAERKLVSADSVFCELVLMHTVNKKARPAFILYEPRKLDAYDRENGSDYFKTLKEYLNAQEKVNTAAKSLFIDHSTLIYRLKKISSLLDLDLDDSTHMNSLRISMRAWDEFRYLND